MMTRDKRPATRSDAARPTPRADPAAAGRESQVASHQTKVMTRDQRPATRSDAARPTPRADPAAAGRESQVASHQTKVMTRDQRPATRSDAARPTPRADPAAAGRESQVASRPYPEDQLLPLSAVSQYVHCPRRCALIHLEQAWSENVFTAEGTCFTKRLTAA